MGSKIIKHALADLSGHKIPRKSKKRLKKSAEEFLKKLIPKQEP